MFRMLGRGLRGLWRLLDGTLRVLVTLLFIASAAALVWAVVALRPAPLQDKTTLLLDLRGPLVEQRSGSWRDTVFDQAREPRSAQVQLRDVLRVLEAAAMDPKIVQAVLLLDEFKGAGLASQRDLTGALQRFKASGKPLVAWGSNFDQRQYHLAAAASEIWLHPMGLLYIEGYGRYRSYFRDALDKLGISVNLIRVGAYKSAGETFTESGPSPASLEADRYLNEGLWATYTADVETARKLPPGSLPRIIDELPQRLAAAGGDLARFALEARLVDGLKTRDELRQLMIERGARDDEHKSFRQVRFDDYLSRLPSPAGSDSGEALAVVVAEGEIDNRQAPPGRIGGLSTSALIRKAREDERIKALVLRVDSPGGSAFGSELIRRELELTRAAGKPVVVSMGDVAASGGYWIATAADEVIADAATVTGSIGVFTLLPTAEKTLDKLGVQTGGASTTWLGDAYDPRRGLDPRFAALVQMSVDHIYAEFIAKVAAARRSTPPQIDALAQGRVWTGAQAKERQLVDRLGGFEDALKAAAQRGKLPGADNASFGVTYLERDPGRLQRLLQRFGGTLAASLAGPLQAALPTTLVQPQAVREMQQELSWLAEMTQQREPYLLLVHCLCREP